MLVDEWLAALEQRHLADLTFAEVARALRALSATYVESRSRLDSGAALAGRGKRAAFALFYGPLHFLLVDQIVRRLPNAVQIPTPIVDFGCGTGVAGAAWALACEGPHDVVAIDKSAWALGETAWTCRQFGIRARTSRADLTRALLPNAPAPVVAAYALNELPDAARDRLLDRLLQERGRRRILIVEPLARRIAPWWDEWAARVRGLGGRVDEWRIPVELPPIVAKLDRAAGLDHRELTGRSSFF